MRVISVVSVVALSLSAVGCKKDKEPAAKAPPAQMKDLVARPAAVDPAKLSAPALFANVPADTPYMIASFEALPLEYYAKFKRALGPALDRALYRFRALADDDRFDRLVTAVLEELDGKWNAAGLETVGIDPSPRFALYGLGIAPIVFRIEVKDDKAVLATIERIAKRAEMTLPAPQDMQGRAFWRIPYGGDGAAIVALADNQLVGAVGPATEIDRLLGLILGIDKPAQSMAGGKQLSELMTRHGFGPHMIAFADTKRMITQGLALAGRPVSPACTAEIDRVSGRVPRFVFGYSKIDMKLSSGGMVLELAPDLTSAVAALKVEVPGLAEAVADQPLLAFGGGVDLERGRQLGIAAAQAVRKLGEACELESVVEAASSAADGMSSPLPPPVAKITGFVMTLHDIAFDAGRGGMPDKLDGYALVTSSDAKGLFGAIESQMPMLAGLGIKSDGKLHAVSGLPVPWPVHAGVGSRVIIGGIGDKGRRSAEKLIDASAAGKSPFLAMSYDYGKFMELQSKLESLTGDVDDLAAEAQRDLNASLATLFGRAVATVDVNDKGLAFWASMEMK